MSLETTVMKNLIDMGIVDKGSDMYCSYRTPDGNYIINMNRKKRLSFLSDTSDSCYFCSIEILTNMNTPILSFQTNEIDISRLIDEFYNLVEYDIGDSIYHYINPNNTNCIPKMIGLYKKDYQLPIEYNMYNMMYNQMVSSDYLIEIFDIIDESFVKRISIPMNKSTTEELLEKMYYTFLIDVPDELLHPEYYPNELPNLT